MALLYVVAAWLIMQVTEVMIALAELPTGTGQIVLVLLAIGFPFALILSWIYELTPEGLSLESDTKAGQSITHITGRRFDFVVIALLCAAVTVFAYDKWWMSGPPITSVAVLPLENLSTEPGQQSFVDGMTEILTAELGQIRALQVVSRTSAMRYAKTGKSLPEIARELNVDAIVEGSVQQAGDEARFTLQLIDGRTDRNLWSQSYQRNLRDVLTLQGEIARTVSDEIQITLSPQTEARFAQERSVTSDALRLWVVGNHHLKGYSSEHFEKALQAFTEASNRDPEFAGAFAGIAQAYTNLGGWYGSKEPRNVLHLARSAAEEAIRLDPSLAEAHFALAEIHRFEWNWNAAEREFEQGMRLNPSDTTGMLLYVNFLGSMGRFDESTEVAKKAVRLDPLSPAVYNELALSLLLAGMRDDALEQYEKSQQLDPDLYWTQWSLAEFHISASEHGKAMPYMAKLRDKLDSLPPSIIGLVGGLYGRAGLHDDAKDILSYLLTRRENEYIPASTVAYLYVGLKDEEASLAWLQKAFNERSIQLTWLNEDYWWDGLRDDPKFIDILARMNFPDATE